MPTMPNLKQICLFFPMLPLLQYQMYPKIAGKSGSGNIFMPRTGASGQDDCIIVFIAISSRLLNVSHVANIRS